jgi:hypothetical protein
MAPWRLGVLYDRPIPRRIAEEAGVPREYFGQKKMASVVELPTPNVPFDKDLNREYLEFLESNSLISKLERAMVPLIHAYNEYVVYKGPQQNIRAYYLDRLLQKLTNGRHVLHPVYKRLDGSIFCFSANKVAASYREFN